VIRYSALILAFTIGTATAQPLRFGPAARVAPFTAGAAGSDYQGRVAPRVNGFVSYWLHDGELWSAPLAGLPPRPNPATAHSLGVSATDFAETVNGPMIVDTDGVSTFVRLLSAPPSAETLVGAGNPDGIECNASRCLVSMDNGNSLAVVDTAAQLVKLLPRPPVARARVAWATDSDGFLVLLATATENRAISIANDGSIRADVQTDRLFLAATTFNGDHYVVFYASGAGVTAFTMTVDGHLSSSKTITQTQMFPSAVAWNGSENLLVSLSNLGAAIPEAVAPNALLGLRIGPDLTPIGAQPFQIAPADGANYPTSVAWNGSIFYVVWTHTAGALLSAPGTISHAVEGAAISATGDVVARDLVAWGSVPQTWPRVASGAQAVVVWSEFDAQAGTATLRYSISGHAFTVASGYPIDVVPLGEDYLVAWQDAGRSHAAILTSDLRRSEVTLPAIDYGNVYVAANHDHWLIAASMAPNLVTVAISRDGTVSPPRVVAQQPYVLGLASDGDRFFLAARNDFILDAAGSPIAEKQPHFGASQVDFAGGVYGALSGGGTLDRYDRDGNFIGSTKYAVATGNPVLSHIGSRFVIVDGGPTSLAQVVTSDGTLLARDVPVPDITIARSDSTTSAAVETRYPMDMWNRPSPALFLETVSIADFPPHRAVRH
jgi:hypothetical protein